MRSRESACAWNRKGTPVEEPLRLERRAMLLSRLVVLACLTAAVGCATDKTAPARPAGGGFDASQLVKTDIDRVAWDHELFDHVPEFVDGHLVMPERPGWGIVPNEEAIRAHPPKQSQGLLNYGRKNNTGGA